VGVVVGMAAGGVVVGVAVGVANMGLISLGHILLKFCTEYSLSPVELAPSCNRLKWPDGGL